MSELEVRELRYFRAVAEELNFSRAAERLGMAQPPLSRAISQLERRLGVRLFERDTRRVELTEAGVTLLVEAATVLDAVTAAEHRTRRAGSTLVVTAKPGVASELLRRIAAAHPTRVEIIVSGYGEQTVLVRTGRVDVALVGSPHSALGLDTTPLVTEPRFAALPAGHPLAAHTTLTRADLVGQPVPQWPGDTPEDRDYWTGQQGPVAGPTVHDSSQLLEVIALGQAVALIPATLAERNQRADLAYRPCIDASPYTISLAWPAGSRNKEVAAFVRTATEVADQQGTAA